MHEEKEFVNAEANNKEPLFEAETTFTEEIYKTAYKSIYGKSLTITYVALAISLLMLIMNIILDEDNTFFVFLLLLIFFFVIYIIIVAKTTKINITTALESKPNLKSKFSFYEDYFVINSISDNSNGTITKKYSNIKLIKQDSKYLYLTFDGMFTVIDLDTCKDNEAKLLGLLTITNVETGTNKTVKRILLVAFIVSIVSIWLALILVAFSIASSPLPDFPLVMLEHMWKLYLIIPIPLASVILGVKFIKKGYKCKKNIVAGIIVAALLFLYGSFSAFLSLQISHDTNFLTEISNTTNINIPTNAYISITYDYQVEGDSLAMAKFNDNTMYTNDIEGNPNWKKDTSFIPSNVNNLYILLTFDYEYYLVFNVTTNTYNTFEGELVFLAYDLDTNVLFVYCCNC